MSSNYGGGVSRVLDPTGRAFLNVLWQEGRPPLDAELTFLQDLATDWRRIFSLRSTPSGWLGNETNLSADFQTNANWSNWFRFGRQRTGESQSILWAVVNGWVIPVAGTRTGAPPGSPNDSDTTNIIALDPPPSNSGDFRVDFAFLEVWQARISPSPSATNKPSASAIWRYGNVESGMSFLPDDMLDPAIGFETTQRVQLQYRIRVVKGLVGLTGSPDGFDPAVVKAQGAAGSPTSFAFQNMRAALGDPGLWRAGDGTPNALGTVDGYSYAIPIAAVFRRNGIVWMGDPSQNLNGAFNRNPLAIDRTGILTFTGVPTLASSISATATTLSLATTTNLPLPVTPSSPVLIRVGDELMTYAGITGSTVIGLTRGVNGTRAESHASGTVIQIVSTRPDGLFADQVATTDILDLRHVVNPNGFDYDAVLRSNLDKLLRGQLRANWKRTGAGPQGPFVHYQDKIAAVGSGTALGVTRLDGADNIRTIFSDAAVAQPVEVIAKANSAGLPAPIGATWSLALNVSHTSRATSNQFSANDVLTIPISQFKSGLPGGDADQVRFAPEVGVKIRIDGQSTLLDPSQYTVSPANPGPNDDLAITLGPSFPGPTTSQLYITVHVLYGPGRGLSRRPDALHSVSYVSPNVDLLLQQSGVPATNLPTRISWAPLWSKYRSATYKNTLPSTSETYADLGSKTVVLQPFRRIEWPTEFRTMDGSSANVAPSPFNSGTSGTGVGSTAFTDATKNFTTLGVLVGDILAVGAGPAAGKYVVTAVAPGGDVTKLTLGAPMPVATNVTYDLSHTQGLMPLYKRDAVTPKWATTDPLQLFSGTTEAAAATKNLYVTLPRHMVPGWGEVKSPVLWQDAGSGVFAEGVNFMCLSKKGAPPFADGDKNFVPYANGALTYAVFSTFNFNPPGTSAAHNAAFTFGGVTFAGMRFFTDTRGLGRKGLELPPFYGIARLFAVYEAGDYQVNGSAYNPTTRAQTGGGAKNLLRQNYQGPTFWIEIDDDGDSSFVLNADALDLTKSVVNPISAFGSGNYVIEASIFGFDRGAFDLSSEFRMVLTRPGSTSQMRNQAVDPTRTNNIGAVINGPTSVLPGPATSSDQVVVNFSRTPYQGDAWGSQTNYADIGYAPGPLQSGVAYQLSTTSLTADALTRPNQKVLEVLASVGFATTLGTGRLAGDTLDPGAPPSSGSLLPFDLRGVGYEDPTAYPPSSPIATRPKTLLADAASGEASVIEVETSYLGCTERLPLGALWRDKDFRGGSLGLGDGMDASLVYLGNTGVGALPGGLAKVSSLEQTEALLDTASVASGTPGDVVVHVDGEQGNYSLLTNFRTARGGSAFTASGAHPGGEVGAVQGRVQAPASHTNAMVGRAYLVRNAVTNVGATEVSAGDELMMLVVTNVEQLKTPSATSAFVRIGTNGTQEGYAAADIYRIEGHPILTNNVRYSIDPSTIVLSPKVT